MRQALRDLLLDPELVDRSIVVQRGLGTAYAHLAVEADADERRGDLTAFAATCFRRAGAHAILADDLKLSRELFGEAAKQYARLRKPYALMMWALGDSSARLNEYLREVWPTLENRQTDLPSGLRRQHVYTLLYLSVAGGTEKLHFGDFDYSRRLIVTELEAMNVSPTGVLGIPVQHYIALANAFANRNGPESILEALFPFIGMYDIAFRTAQSKRSHWRQLRLPFHPAEPDTLSVLSIASRALDRYEFSLVDAVERLPLSFGSRTVIQSFLRSDSDDTNEDRLYTA